MSPLSTAHSAAADKNRLSDQPSTPPPPPESRKKSERLAALSKALNAGAKLHADAAIDDDSLIDDFKPHFLHRAHEPFRTFVSSSVTRDDAHSQILTQLSLSSIASLTVVSRSPPSSRDAALTLDEQYRVTKT